MKTIGLIGGLGPEATVDYYNQLIDSFKQTNNGKLDYPEIIIYSVNMDHFIGLLETDEFGLATDYIARSLNKLLTAGADFGAISANTPHLLFDQVQSGTTLKLISIVDACVQAAVQMKLKRCLLLGTKFVMKNQFYHELFHRHGIEVISPNESQISQINHLLFSELELGIIKDETQNIFLQLIAEIKASNDIDSVILGCTELPLMFRETHYLDIPFLNTTKIHVEAIIQEYFARDTPQSVR